MAQELGNPYRALPSTVAEGEPLSRAAGQYGKGHSYLAPTPADLGPAAPHSPMQESGMRRHPLDGTLVKHSKGKPL